MNDIAELRALKSRLAELEAKTGRTPEEPSPEELERRNRQGTVARDRHGSVITDPDLPSYDDRNRARAAEAAAERAEYEAKCRAGLPSGLYRDPFGMVRNQDGKIAAVEEVEGRPEETPAAIARAKVEAGQRAEHHKFLEENGLLGGVEQSPESAASAGAAADEKE